jgi:hypothetical protein
MIAATSIFFEIHLPTPSTWFYFSVLLALALFFKFSRLLSMRNWDVLTLFLPMPGLLLLIEGDGNAFWGYLWLLGASVYFFVRCLLDLALERRPALSPNLTLGGLACLAAALFASLIAVAVRQPTEPSEAGERPNLPIDRMRRMGEDLLRQQAPVEVDDGSLQMWVERGVTVFCHLAIVVGLVLVGWRQFDDLHGGVAAATLYLLLPYTYLLMPATRLGVDRWDHAWPMALMIWMVLAYRRPLVSGLFLGLAIGTVLFPLLTFPVWFSFYRRRGAGRFALSTAAAAGLCLAVLGAILWINGELPRALHLGWSLSAWEPWKPPAPEMHGLWEGATAHWAYRLPIALAYLAFVITTLFWPMPKNLAHVLALSAAVLIGIQLWYADQGGIYVLWYLPFLLLLVFRPNLSNAQPSPPTQDWLTRLRRSLYRFARRLLHLPTERQPTAPHIPQALS